MHETMQTKHYFMLNSSSDFDVLTKERTVTLLSWNIRDGPPINEGNAAFSCFVLLPVKERTDTYTLLGLFSYFQYAWDEDVPVQDLDKPTYAEKWFGDTPARGLVTI